MIRCISYIKPTLTLTAIAAVAGSTHSLNAGVIGPTLEIPSLDGENGFVLNGIDAGDASDSSISSVGDVIGDGIDDLIIGASGASPNGQTSAGESYIVFGGTSLGASGTLELSTLNGTNGFVCNGISVYSAAGPPFRAQAMSTATA